MSRAKSSYELNLEERFNKAKPYWDRFEEYSKALGNNARTFGFAGLALVWIFHERSASGIVIPAQLYLATLCFVSALALDLARLFVGALEAEQFGNSAFLDGAGNWLDKAVWSTLARVRPTRVAVLLETALVLAGFVYSIRFLLKVVNPS